MNCPCLLTNLFWPSRHLLAALLLIIAQLQPAQAQAVKPVAAKIKVYLVGTYHFDGSSLDVVKSGKTDMQSAQKQQEVEDFVNRLTKTHADKVFVEWKPQQQRFVDSTYALYLRNQFRLRNNEVYQVGYRLAKKLNLPRVICADADGEWNYDEALVYAKQHGQSAILENAFEPGKSPQDSVGRLIHARIQAIQGADKPFAGRTITDLIAANNTEAAMQGNMYWYMLVSSRIGGGNNYVGADLAGEFYKRNMRIYTNMLRHIDVQRDKAVVLIIGAGHVSFLKQQLQYNPLFEVQDIVPLLTAKAK
ncbi:DUF5694 domain-containing protein [Hymenobacter wooponensis]|uniref:TraB/GumN family protein n=1 Tax=Hymenobacter wooponensis TaxID=1525360 RepID=A0A4Z0MR32_9BACT|nr:DUF5694 domain-containing protein [Hymenobacter wooponensis]TGD81818.1 hypothetical protein EU557_09805 [Hymenobacter wooponensis]